MQLDFKIGMIAPAKAGKTSLMTAIFHEMKTKLSGNAQGIQYWADSKATQNAISRALAEFTMNDSDCVIRTMMRLSGGGQHITNAVNIEEYLHQTEEYAALLDESKFNKLLQAWAIKDAAHPFSGIRSLEIRKWFEKNKNALPESADAPLKNAW